MARNALPVGTGNGPLGKLIGGAVTIAVLVYVVKYPTEAANTVSGIFGMLGHLVDGLASFFSHLHG